METDEQRRERQRQEYWQRCQDLAEKLGWQELLALVPFDREEIRVMLATDPHLNNKGNGPWDKAALEGKPKQKTCYSCGQQLPKVRALSRHSTNWPLDALQETARDRDLPWHRSPGESLSMRVSALKHVATEDARR
jgi:hypothetical protein